MTTYPPRLIEVDLPIKRISGPRPTREVDPPRAHQHAAHLVGTATAGRVPGRDLRRTVARSC